MTLLCAVRESRCQAQCVQRGGPGYGLCLTWLCQSLQPAILMDRHCRTQPKHPQLHHCLDRLSPLAACTSLPRVALGSERRCRWRAAGDAQKVHSGGAAGRGQLCAGHCGGRHRPGGQRAQVSCGEGGLAAAPALVAGPADTSALKGGGAIFWRRRWPHCSAQPLNSASTAHGQSASQQVGKQRCGDSSRWPCCLARQHNR